jgi:hypothetical protein
MTHADLLDAIYHFYPRGRGTFSPEYDDTPEYQRQVAAAQRGRAEYPTWKAMLKRLPTRYKAEDFSLRILGGDVVAACAAKLWLRSTPARLDPLDLGFGCCVSLLVPYYVIYPAGRLEEEPYVREVAREIEATYRGYEPIPPELGNRVVPDVGLDARPLGKATIYDCLCSTSLRYG